MATRLTHAERILQELGVTTPSEIDLEAIAYTQGVRVRYRKLDGCRACVVGSVDHAIVTINIRGSLREKRFSLAHELGHWQYHRGRILFCRDGEIGNHSSEQLSPERVADGFAADLLMPRYLFLPAARAFPRLTFDVVRQISDLFEVGLTEAAIRLVESALYPAILVCHGPNGRKWFNRSSLVPDRWVPRNVLDADSYAFHLLSRTRGGNVSPRKIGADIWLEAREAQPYQVLAQTIRIAGDEVLSLILINDSRMLQARDRMAELPQGIPMRATDVHLSIPKP